MPSLIDIRRRVRAVKSTQQITKAMKMVSASKLRRAQERVVNARPVARKMLSVLNSLAARVDPSAHPLLASPAETSGRTLLIVITADKGLCGSFNSNVIKAASGFASGKCGTASVPSPSSVAMITGRSAFAAKVVLPTPATPCPPIPDIGMTARLHRRPAAP